MISSVCGLRKGVAGPRSTRAARPLHAVNTNDLIVEFGFDDQVTFSLAYCSYTVSYGCGTEQLLVPLFRTLCRGD